MSGSEAIRLRKRFIAAGPSIMAASTFTSSTLAPDSDLLARHDERAGVIVGLDQLAELRRAGDVRALADDDEIGEGIGGGHSCTPSRIRLTTMRRLSKHPCHAAAVNGSRPASRSCARRRDRARRHAFTACFMCVMCSGVVPQQPPAMLSKPGARPFGVVRLPSNAASRRSRPWRWAGRRSDRRCTGHSATRARSARNARISAGPSAQLRPTAQGLAWRTEL